MKSVSTQKQAIQDLFGAVVKRAIQDAASSNRFAAEASKFLETPECYKFMVYSIGCAPKSVKKIVEDERAKIELHNATRNMKRKAGGRGDE